MSRRSLPRAAPPAPDPHALAPLPAQPSRLPALLVALVVEVALGAAVIRLAPRVGAVVAPHPHRVRLSMLTPPKPKPKPPAPKPKPPPPKPKPPPPPKPKPPPPKPAPPPPPPKAPPPPPRPKPRPRPAPPRPHISRKPPPPPAPVPVPAAPSTAAIASATMRYAALLNARVQARLVVPDAARLMHLSGRAVLAIEVAPDGTLRGVRIARSSGIGPIDQAARRAVRAAALPPFLPDMPGHPVTFLLTVRIRN